MVGRIGITEVTPSVDCGRFPAKSFVGQLIDVSAVVFREGHDAVAANVVFTGPGASGRPGPGQADSGRRRAAAPLLRMVAGQRGTDRFHAQVVPDRMGMWTLVVEAWSDPLGTWRHAVEAKVAAGQSPAELANDLETGAQLLARIGRRPRSPLRRRHQGCRRGAPRHRAVTAGADRSGARRRPVAGADRRARSANW